MTKSSSKLKETCRIYLRSEERTIKATVGANLRSALMDASYYFPQNCGGKGQCGHCRVEIHGYPPKMRHRERELLGKSSSQRMACLYKVTEDIEISLPDVQEWLIEKSITDFDFAGIVGDRYGIAVDLGTTVVALYLVSFNCGEIVTQYSFLNPQVHLGGDVMTRLDMAKKEGQRRDLTKAIRQGFKVGVKKLLIRQGLSERDIAKLFLAGNTAMLHLLLGRGGEGLEVAPFRSPLEELDKIHLQPDWFDLTDDCTCAACPVIRGFIGGDTISAIVATDLDRGEGNRLLIDLGTNGEIVLAVKGTLQAVSTAAGPAFEGVGLHNGMPAVKGAVEGFDDQGNPFVIGGGQPVGFCGSGYIAAIARLLKSGKLDNTGLLDKDENEIRRWVLEQPEGRHISVIQDDIRKFQLAKGAIAAGITILCKETGINPLEVDQVIITGSFGNRIDIPAAMKVGLIPAVGIEKVTFLDNAAGRGALLCLGNAHFERRAENLHRLVRIINLGEHPDFQDAYIANMSFK
ncbi:hypothetical protein CEE37_10295 [candidate division LCP-89 bacterium B3_LCP]|uniref:2Fe-2S ferredoxin-type domain-containing protein n=1 Tax=candidate division LCP-89 bacterium B3_LCP TaxID=2012998 RepID=A0A532UYV9_UNCL8|nr:MAG: hypothetical protein CEE37_10295 [candidate division LCP-89 bacterium B3_LCP]